jgi:hypothetical protein
VNQISIPLLLTILSSLGIFLTTAFALYSGGNSIIIISNNNQAYAQSSTTSTTPTISFASSSSSSPSYSDGVNSIVILQDGQRNGPLLVKQIYSDHIVGLEYRQYPLATNYGTPITLYIGQKATNGCNVTLTLLSIDTVRHAAMFLKNVDMDEPCPI